MSNSVHSEQLLFGLLGLQAGLLLREDLVSAFSAWLEDKSQSLEDLLIARNTVGAEECRLIRSLVGVHLNKHAGDVQQSLAALSSVESAARDLMELGDADLYATIAETLNFSSNPSDVRKFPPESVPSSVSSREAGSHLRFRIIRPHAKGGLGEVFLAGDNELNREVALKTIQPRFADNTDSRLRFLQEAEITGRLEHPGIVPVYGLGQYADGRPYYAMRFVRGESLQEAALQFHQQHAKVVEKKLEAEYTPVGQYSIETVEFRKLLGRFIDVCNAIAYANSRGVLHRDLKPGNIMLGKYGETLVVDWGLAKVLGTSGEATASGEQTLMPSSDSGSAPTQIGSAIGTPAYMPPEQANGSLDKLGPASDVYSLGATLYFLITGKAPVQGKSVVEVLEKVRVGNVPHPTLINPHIPRSLAAICMRAMSTNPEDRYPNPQELAEEIERYLADEPTQAYVESLSVRIRRWIRKHPRVVASLATSLLVGLTSTLVIATIVSGKNRQLSVANLELDKVNIVLGNKNLQLSDALNSEREAKQRAEAKQIEAEQAREQEGLAKQEAEDRRQESQRVLSFFTDRVVAAARPKGQDGGLGKTATIRDAIDVALTHISADFEGQPMAEASVRRTIGSSYNFLGEHQLAIAQLKQALELCQSSVGPRHDKTLFTMNELAIAYKYAGDQDNSFRLYEEILDCIRLNFGDEHEDLLTYTNNLGEAYRAAGRLDRALPMLTETLRLRKSALGPSNPNTLTTMNNLALAIEDSGNRAEALPMLEETLRLRREHLGAQHPHTLQSINNLAAAYAEDGRNEEAKSLHEEALRQYTDTLGPEHPSTLISMNNLGKALLALGRTEESIAWYRKAFQGRGEQLGLSHPESFNSMLNLANALFVNEQSDEAISIATQYLDSAGKERTITPPRLAQFLVRVAELLIKHHRYDAATPHLDACADIAATAEVEEWLLPATRGLQGLIMAAKKEIVEAERLLMIGFEGLELNHPRLPPTDSKRLRVFAQGLVDLYDSQDRQEEAGVWRAKLHALDSPPPVQLPK